MTYISSGKNRFLKDHNIFFREGTSEKGEIKIQNE